MPWRSTRRTKDPTRFAEITDGLSNTAFFAEVKRGEMTGTSTAIASGFYDKIVASQLPFATWDGNLPLNDQRPIRNARIAPT